MGADSTPHDHDAILREAVAAVPAGELRAALDRAVRPDFQPPKAVKNALQALRRHHDPVPYLSRPQYRPTIPYLASVLSDGCLTRTIEVLGDDSEDPTEEQLLAAVDTVRPDFSDPVIAVMLAAVAHDELPSSDLCLRILGTDPRYGLAGLVGVDPGAGTDSGAGGAATVGEVDGDGAVTPVQDPSGS